MNKYADSDLAFGKYYEHENILIRYKDKENITKYKKYKINYRKGRGPDNYKVGLKLRQPDSGVTLRESGWHPSAPRSRLSRTPLQPEARRSLQPIPLCHVTGGE